MGQNKAFKLLIVCTGNTCRSPMAEGIAKKIAKEKGLDNFIISSAGTGAVDGYPATDYAIEAAKHWDIDISSHRSKALTKQMAGDADLILTMAPEHAEWVISMDKNLKDITYVLKGFPEPYRRGQARVDDPIGGNLEQYNQTFMELDEILRRIFPDIVAMAEKQN
ncbi:MAG: low molecular weight protein arginine phosphatase [candidate division Zixibacteria bacterium]|nr:low molecular weight protein arginine phosphatase [candidate division Zixibacteria bacterium]